MVKLLTPTTIGAHIAAAFFAIIWAYSSHHYDCLNIGPCKGSISAWVNLNTLAYYSFLVSWLILIFLAFASHTKPIRRAAYLWASAVLAPPATLYLAWLALNWGISATGG